MNEIYAKKEFMILAMLYVANVDGKINQDEVRVILDCFEPSSVAEVRRRFNKMNDTELIHCIDENKAKYVPTNEDRTRLIADLHRIMEADDRHLAIEEYILNALKTMLA